MAVAGVTRERERKATARPKPGGPALLLASALLLGPADPGSALAQPARTAPATLPPAVAAVVDFQKLMTDSKAAKSINDQIETRRKIYLEQLAKEEQRLYEADRELAKQRSVLSPEAFTKRRREFEQQVQEAQRLSQEKRRQLDAARTAAINDVRQAVVQIVNELAEARGFNVVLPSSAVILFSPELDLTAEVLTRLDRRLPVVKVPERGE